MEIEVKYKGEEGMDLFAHPLLAPFLGPRKKTPMSALYYDTPESGCAKAVLPCACVRKGRSRCAPSKAAECRMG